MNLVGPRPHTLAMQLTMSLPHSRMMCPIVPRTVERAHFKASVSRGVAPARAATVRVVAMAKAKKKAKTAPAPSKGFGAVKVAEEKKEPQELDIDTAATITMHKMWVRANESSQWRPLGEILVEDAATAAAAMKERRAIMRDGALTIPEMLAASKGKSTIQYGLQNIILTKEESDGEEEEVSKEPITEVPVTGAVSEEVPAVININIGSSMPPGSIWNRNKDLYGGKARADAFIGKARNVAVSRTGASDRGS